jgi:Hint module
MRDGTEEEHWQMQHLGSIPPNFVATQHLTPVRSCFQLAFYSSSMGLILTVRQTSTCTSTGQKCAGALNYPLIPYVECCDKNLVCAPRRQPIAGTWGSFCIAPADAGPTTAPTTTATGTVAATAVAATTSATGAAVTTAAAAGAVTTTAAAAAGATTTTSAAATTSVAAATMPTMATTPTAEMTPIATALPNTTSATRSPSPSPASSSGSKCFPSTATVELEDGSVVTMDKLSVGDAVKVGPNTFSKVFMFTHKMQAGVHDFVKITTATGASISLTSGHYMAIDGALVAASQVEIGAQLGLGTGAVDKVVSISTVRETGLYNPQTLQGNIVVNGVVASTYTTAVAPQFAHAVLTPLRAFFAIFDLEFSFLEHGGGFLTDMAPRGQLVF